MSSIKDRIAAFNKGGAAPAPAPAPAAKSEPPMGEVLFSNILGKAGTGVLAATFQRRHVAVHVDGGDWWLSMYENAELTKLKGARYSLNGGGVSCSDDKIELTAWLGPASAASRERVTTKFKAASATEAQEWTQRIQMAIGGTLTKMTVVRRSRQHRREPAACRAPAPAQRRRRRLRLHQRLHQRPRPRASPLRPRQRARQTPLLTTTPKDLPR